MRRPLTGLLTVHNACSTHEFVSCIALCHSGLDRVGRRRAQLEIDGCQSRDGNVASFLERRDAISACTACARAAQQTLSKRVDVLRTLHTHGSSQILSEALAVRPSRGRECA